MEQVILTNMCMIVNEKTNKVVVQDRVKGWNGLTFPGGKLETGEAIIPSTIREVREETGLEITDLVFCGVKDWYDYKKKQRYIVFFLKTTSYEGTLITETEEGRVTWMDLEELKRSKKLAPDFGEMLEVFLGNHQEFFYEENPERKEDNEKPKWITKLY